MAEKLDPSVIKKTQDTLGHVIQAPALTEKLLNRPPVQFIQDIVKSVIKNTGFMKGLYKSEELESAYIKESKENKLLFLTKLVTIVSVVVKEQLTVKPSKIAAGSEADKTNDLLQNLAKAVNMKPDNEEVVKKALKKLKPSDGESDKPEKPKRDEDRDSRKERDKKPERERAERDKTRDKERSSKREESKDEKPKESRSSKPDDRQKSGHDREKSSRRGERDKTRESDRGKDREKEKERERDRDKDRDRDSRDKRESKDRRHRDKDESKDKDRDSSRKHKDRDSKKETDEKESRSSKREEKSRDHRRGSKDAEEEQTPKHTKITYEEDDADNGSENDGNTSRKRPTSAKGPRSHIDREDSASNKAPEQDETLRSSLRPTTARPGAPRPRLQNEPEEPVQSKIHTSSKAKSTLIVNSDSDDDFVVKEQKVQDDESKKKFRDLNNDNDDFNQISNGQDPSNQEHGALVKKILESKEQLEYGSELNRNKDFKPMVQNDLQRKKERERIQKEIDRLKDSIQTLTKASIPLGRTLEFLQEDIEMMQKELVKWTDESEQNLKAFKRQQAEAQSLLEPYKGALADIENQISDQSEKIASVKRKILLNEEKTSKLLFSIGKKN